MQSQVTVCLRGRLAVDKGVLVTLPGREDDGQIVAVAAFITAGDCRLGAVNPSKNACQRCDGTGNMHQGKAGHHLVPAELPLVRSLDDQNEGRQ